MRVLSRADFLKTIEAVGVRLDSKYPKSAILGFPNKPDVARFWAVPGEPQTIPHFAATMINLLGPWKSIFVWKHLGSWMVEVKGEDLNDDIQALLYKGLGIQSNSADILVFDRQELSMLIALIFNQLIFGWNLGDDLYLIPDDGRHIVHTDHHDVVHVSFQDAGSADRFVNAMAERGYQLPDELPDATFKRPQWMK